MQVGECAGAQFQIGHIEIAQPALAHRVRQLNPAQGIAGKRLVPLAVLQHRETLSQGLEPGADRRQAAGNAVRWGDIDFHCPEPGEFAPDLLQHRRARRRQCTGAGHQRHAGGLRGRGEALEVADKSPRVGDVDIGNPGLDTRLRHAVVLALERAGAVNQQVEIEGFELRGQVDRVALEAQPFGGAGESGGTEFGLEPVAAGDDQGEAGLIAQQLRDTGAESAIAAQYQYALVQVFDHGPAPVLSVR